MRFDDGERIHPIERNSRFRDCRELHERVGRECFGAVQHEAPADAALPGSVSRWIGR